MRMMMKVMMPVEGGNKSISDGTLQKTVMTFVEKYHPEASYFLPEHGRRTAIFFFDMKDPSMIPSVCEPFFTTMNASIELMPAMNLEDMKTGVAKAMGH